MFPEPIGSGPEPESTPSTAAPGVSIYCLAAIDYATHGIRVLPCHGVAVADGKSVCTCFHPACKSPAKHPRTKHGVKDATTDAEVIRGWWGPDGKHERANIGAAMGGGIIAIDVDVRHGGAVSMAELERRHSSLPPTATQDTPSGGWHLLYRVPDSVTVKNRVSIAPGIDVRSDGGYILVAPSVGINGKSYVWRKCLLRAREPKTAWRSDGLGIDAIADAPQWLLDLLTGAIGGTAEPEDTGLGPGIPVTAPESLATRISAVCTAAPDRVIAFFATHGIVGLHQQGDDGWWKGSAPWTDAGKDPSFGVHPTTGSWKAHRDGGATGGLIDFLVRELPSHMSEINAAREVCRALGIKWKGESPQKEHVRIAQTDTLKAAMATIDEVDQMEDVGAILTEAFASRVAVLWARDPVAFGRLSSKIEQKFRRGYRRSDFLRAVKHFARDLPSVDMEMSIAEEDRGDPFGWFPSSGCPRNSIVPEGFRLSKNGAICRYTERATQDGGVAPSLTPICGDPIFVVGVGINLATKDHTLTLAWRKGSRWFRCEFDRGDVCEGKGLKGLAQKGFSVSCLTWNLLADWLVQFERVNFHLLPVRYVTSRFGPAKDEDGRYLGFMCGRSFIPFPDAPKNEYGNPHLVSFAPADTGDMAIAESIHQRGTLDDCVAALARVAMFPRAMIGLYASIAPPLLSVLGSQNFGIDWWRDTTQGKTKTMMIAACPWGNTEPRGGGFIGTWDGTRVAFERRTTLLNGMPVIADESQRAKNPEEMGVSVYDVINGQARARGTIKGLAASLGGHVVLLSTGERPLVHAMKFGGLKARVISIHGGPFGDISDPTRDIVDDVSEILLKNYGHIAPIFIAWIHDHISEWKAWRAQWEDERAAYRAMAKGDNVTGRLCDYLATLEMAARLLHRAIPLPWSPDEIVEAIWAEVESGAADADIAKAAFEDLVGWCRCNEASFIGKSVCDVSGEPIQPHGGWFGIYRETGEWEWGIAPHKVADFLSGQGYDVSVLKTLRDRGWLFVPSGERKRGRDTLTVRVSKRVFRLYALNRKTIGKLDSDTEADLAVTQ